LYPPDGHLFPRYTDCSTCCRLKPGRSKHCTATGGCVARFDHWCIWLNNAVGLMNTRWFLAFLAATTATAAYGAALCVAAIRGDMRRRGAWELVWNDPGSGRAVGLADDRSLLAAWVFAHYGMAAGVAAFLGIACWIVAGFGGVQVWRVATGVTTNEAFKWEEAAAERRERAANSAVAGAQRLPPNAYDRGWRRNFAEVLFPRQHLARALRASRKTQ
jgi:palmitoyltransferase